MTATDDPRDIDAVLLVPEKFKSLIDAGDRSAPELDERLMTRRPEELFAAADDLDWIEWVEFLSRTRERDRIKKGLIEVAL